MRSCRVNIAGLVFLGSLAAAQASAAPTLTPSAIDKRIAAEWKREKITPAARVDDARYLRRIYLDILGVIPPPDAVTAFLANTSPNKRMEAVEALLASPRYADRWTTYWDNVLMGRKPVRNPFVDRVAFRQWLHTQFEKNVPYNRFVYDLLTATGRNSAGGSYAKAMGFASPADRQMEMDAKESNNGKPGSANINGAVNWTLKYVQTTADLSGSASKLFMGVQIQCAQCHDHKTEKWKQEDFRRFTACFVSTRPIPVDMARDQQGIRRVDLQDVRRPVLGPRRRAERNEYANAAPTALDGSDFSTAPNRRQALAEWMTAKENPWFAQALVNRMWAHFLGRGFVDPIDDFRESNPPVLPDLLKRLADDFTANGYDLKHLIRTICATEVYQRTVAPPSKADPDNKLWSRFRLTPMGPEELMDSLISATNMGKLLERVAGSNLDNIKFQMQRQFTFLFDVDEEFEQKEFEGTIPQALLLLNGNLVNRAVNPIPGTALAEVLALPGGEAAKIEALYLRTLSRKPTAAETKKWVAFLNAPRDVVTDDAPEQAAPGSRRPFQANRKQIKRGGGGPDPLARLGNRLDAQTQTYDRQAYEDMFWALLNSSEFAFNH